jgi:hypothetical protein
MSSLKTNFNVSPYFDDYDEDKNFYKILFRPSVAVQARELTQLQTILQKQIERFGNNVFKDGTIVDGVAIFYYPNLDYISIEDKIYFANGVESTVVPTDLNVYSLDPQTYIVTNSTDSNNAVRANIKLAKNGLKSTAPNTNRFYLDYITFGTDSSNNKVSTFLPGDTLYIYSENQNEFGTLDANNLLYTTNTIATNSSFTSNGQSYSVGVSDGIIFQKGFFSKVEPQVVTVNEFSTNVTGYVVGFETAENIINDQEDLSLTDNALGYPNENAPGAYRLKLNPTLVSKLKTDTSNTNFFSIVEFDSNEPTQQRDITEYNAIQKELAKRTYEESGDYFIKPFTSETRVNSSNSQSFFYEMSSGIAYVRGNRIEKISTVNVEADRAIATEFAENQIVTANYGNYVICDEFVGVFDTEQLSEVTLYDSPQNSISEYEGSTSTPVGTSVGKANVRAVSFEDGVKGSPTGKYYVYLFNIQMNSGKSFSSDVKSLYMSGSFGDAKADIVLEGGIAKLKDTTKKSSVFDSGLLAIKRLTNNTGIGDTNFTYSQIKSGTINGSGILTISLDTPATGASTERLNQSSGSVLTGSLLEEYDVFLSTNAYSANLTGNVSITAGSSSVIGDGTDFTNELVANSNIRVYANSTQTYIKRIVSIGNSTSLTVDSSFSESNTESKFGKYFVTGTPLPLANVTINSNTSFSANLGLTLDSGSQTIYASYPVNRNQANPIPKIINKNKFVKIDCSNNVATSVGPWDLGFSEVHKIRNIYVGTTYANTNPNRTTWFNLDRGNREDTLEHSRLFVKPEYASNISGSTKFLIELDHFTANTSASVGFFSVESYPIDDVNTANTNAIQTIELPVENESEIRNFIDFRSIKSNTAISSSTEGSATINPALNTNNYVIPATGQHMIVPDSNFVADYEYYLPRRDIITINPIGEFIVNQGVPSEIPQAPFVENDQVLLKETFVPPYPSATRREYETYKSSQEIKIFDRSNRRYTMKDIGTIDRRLKRLEYYTVLNALEQKAKDLTIPDVNGLDRFKNGIFADPFNSHKIGNVSDFEYKISIDKDETVARPFFEKHNIDFKFTPNTSSDSVKSSNVKRRGPLVLLDYEDERYISQEFSTKYRVVAESAWQWNGIVDLYPNYDYFQDETIVPNVNVDIDLSTPWEQFAESPFGTIFGDWRNISSTSSTTQTGQNINTTTSTVQEQIINELQVNTLTENIDLGAYVKDVSLNPYMRSRVVAFLANGMKPRSNIHVFFDNVNVDEHCAPGELSGLTEPQEGLEDRIVNQNGEYGTQLVANESGTVVGLFRIPERTFRTGERVFELNNVRDISEGEDARSTIAFTTYMAESISVTKGSTTLVVRQPQLSTLSTSQRRTLTRTQTIFITGEPGDGDGDGGAGGDSDPMAQSFTIENLPSEITGIYLNSVGLYFRYKDRTVGCSVFICEMENNMPDQSRIIGQAHLTESEISVSRGPTFGEPLVETIFELDFPVYLMSNKDYAFIVQPDGGSPNYAIWTCETGDFDVTTDQQVFSNPYSGIMFISANRKTWTAIQKEDITFNLYRAKFNQLNGNAIFKNEDDEYLSLEGFTRANTSLGISVGDVVLTVNGSISTQNTLNIFSNTLANSVSGRVQYINEAEGELWIDSSTANSTTYFSSTVNPVIAVYRIRTSNTQEYHSSISESRLIAYSNVTSVDNLKYHAVVPKFGVLQPSRTTLTYNFKGTSNSNITDSAYHNVVNEYDYQFIDTERHAMSKSNEINDLSSNKSSIFDVNLQSQSDLTSPAINLSRKSSFFIENLINNDYTDEHTRYGNALSKYISKKIVLADGQEAEDLKVYMTAYRPADTDVKVYAKFWNDQDPQEFNDKVWTELQYDNGGSFVFSSPTNTRNFIEYEFSVPTINAVSFGAFANVGVNIYNPLSGGISIESSNTTISAKEHTFNANTDVNNSNNTINIADANTYFSVGDEVIYNVNAGNTAITGLTENNKYYVSFSNTTQMALSESRTGANIDISATSVSETGHFFTGTFFTEDFTVGDRIRVESTDYFAVRTITNISNNTSMIVDNGLESTNTAAVYYVFASGGGDGIVEYENSDGSRFVGYKEVSLKIVLLSSNPVRVPRLNDVRGICLQV